MQARELVNLSEAPTCPASAAGDPPPLAVVLADSEEVGAVL